MEARKYCWFHCELEEVNDHEDEAVAGDCAVAGIVDVVVMRPKLDDQSQRTKAPID